MLTDKWQQHYMKICRLYAEISRDPSTKCGCVIVRPDKTFSSAGFNGFPAGSDDSEELYLDREFKLKHIIHAEENAIKYSKDVLDGYYLFTYPIPPCVNCIDKIIENKLGHIYYSLAKKHPIWVEQFMTEGQRKLQFAGISTTEVILRGQ